MSAAPLVKNRQLYIDGQWTEAYGLYRDRYVRRDNVWRIAERWYSSLARRGPTTESFPLPEE